MLSMTTVGHDSLATIFRGMSSVQHKNTQSLTTLLYDVHNRMVWYLMPIIPTKPTGEILVLLASTRNHPKINGRAGETGQYSYHSKKVKFISQTIKRPETIDQKELLHFSFSSLNLSLLAALNFHSQKKVTMVWKGVSRRLLSRCRSSNYHKLFLWFSYQVANYLVRARALPRIFVKFAFLLQLYHTTILVNSTISIRSSDYCSLTILISQDAPSLTIQIFQDAPSPEFLEMWGEKVRDCRFRVVLFVESFFFFVGRYFFIGRRWWDGRWNVGCKSLASSILEARADLGSNYARPLACGQRMLERLQSSSIKDCATFWSRSKWEVDLSLLWKQSELISSKNPRNS